MATFLLEVPFGRLFAEVSAAGLRRLDFIDGVRQPPLSRVSARSYPLSEMPMSPLEQHLAAAVEQQLREYCDGQRRAFDLPLDLSSGSEFRRRVWQVIGEIPFGETLSYAQVAAAAGNPNAYRASGSACGANPVAIVLPCHRVVGSDARLHGFGGGLDIKAWLLAHEQRVLGVSRELLTV